MQIKKEASIIPQYAGYLSFFWRISYGHTASKFARSFLLSVES